MSAGGRHRWALGHKRGDGLRRALCGLVGHEWTMNPRATQQVCYRCWTVEEIT